MSNIFLLPIIATPHSALAVGFAFLIMPSGWLMRIFAQFSSGGISSNIVTLGDPFGLAFALGLVLKEFPFLLLVALGQLTAFPMQHYLKTAMTLGYQPNRAWQLLIVPELLFRMRLPIFFSFAYAITNVEMALLLGPSLIPSFPVLIYRWLHSPDISQILIASAGAVFLIGMVVLSALGMRIFAFVIGRFHASRSLLGKRQTLVSTCLDAFDLFGLCLVLLAIFSLLANAFGAFAWRWSFPNFLPESYSLKLWTRAFTGHVDILGNTLILAIASVMISLLILIIWFEFAKGRLVSIEKFFFLPLILPQLSLLLGAEFWLTLVRIPEMLAIIFAHILFVLPYMHIIIAEPWRNFDPKLMKTARQLQKSEFRILLQIKLPILLKPIFFGIAVGVAVSIALYLPTVFAGRGRIDTITTEAISLASGSDRRLTSVYAFLQAFIPIITLIMATLFPRIIFRHRRIMRESF